MSKPPGKICVLLIYSFLAVSTFVIYLPVHSYDFINYDDDRYVTANPHVRSEFTSESIIWAFTTGAVSNWHPLTWLSHMLDYQLFELNPGYHHLTSLLFHICNTLLLFMILKGLTGAVWRSAFVAAAFALHPLHIESVAWIAERKDVLSTFFGMLAIVGYMRYVKKPSIGRYLLTLVTFALGLMSKPMLVTLPFILLLLDYWPLGRFEISKEIKQHNYSKWQLLFRLVHEKIPFFALSVISSVVTVLVQQITGAVPNVNMVSLYIRIANSFVSYFRYISKMVWPSRLAIFYPHPVNEVPFVWFAVAFIVLLAISIFVLRLTRNHKYLLVGWLWFLITLAPVIGLIQAGSQSMADRYTYISLTGLFIIIAWGAFELLAKWRYRKIVLTISASVILLAMTVRTHVQLSHWSNSESIFTHTLNVTQNNLLAHHNLGIALAGRGKLKEAIQHFRQALQINPYLADSLNALGLALSQQGKLKEAAQQHQTILKAQPGNLKALNELGILLGRQGKLHESVKYLNRALEINPDLADVHCNLAITLIRQNNVDQAIVHFEKAIQLQPNFLTAHYQLAKILVEQNKIKDAVIHFKKVLQLDPYGAQPINDLAWLLATHKNADFRNPKEAIRLAEHGCELKKYSHPLLLDTLAAAYAADGRFGEAVNTAEKALELLRPTQFKEITEAVEKRLQLYKENKPYIE